MIPTTFLGRLERLTRVDGVRIAVVARPGSLHRQRELCERDRGWHLTRVERWTGHAHGLGCFLIFERVPV